MLDKINKKILNKGVKTSPLTPIFGMIKEFGGFGDILGREFEVYDSNNKCVYKVVQKPIKLNKLNIALEELQTLIKLENEANKKGNINKSRKGG